MLSFVIVWSYEHAPVKNNQTKILAITFIALILVYSIAANDFLFLGPLSGILFVGSKIYLLSFISYLMRTTPERPGSIKDLLYKTIFFPILLAGPILTIDNCREERSRVNWRGFLLHTFSGLLKILVIANALEIFTLHLHSITFFSPGTSYLLCLFLFTFYYSSLSGLTEIFRGIAQIFAVSLPKTFIMPYLAHSPADFWLRWNTSIPAWVQQNIYFPLLVKFKKTNVALIISFFAIAFWHEISIKFLAWGLIWILITYTWQYLKHLNLLTRRVLFFHFFLFSSVVIELCFSQHVSAKHLDLNSNLLLKGGAMTLLALADDILNSYLEPRVYSEKVQPLTAMILMAYTVTTALLVVFLGIYKNPMILYFL